MADLLAIPGPVELSSGVRAMLAEPPLSHTAPAFIAAFGVALHGMRAVWGAGPDHQPFVVAGSGTFAMEMAANNVIAPGERALVVETGLFSDRMAQILERRGAIVTRLSAQPGETVQAEALARVLAVGEPPKAVFCTHVDTSTGVLLDVKAVAAVVRVSGALLVVDGVCSVAGERTEQAADGIDVLLTASQKALSAPPGLALLVASPRALAARAALKVLPPLVLDFDAWRPIHEAYEAGLPSYFATPATGLVRALATAIDEIVGQGVAQVVARHERVAEAMRQAFAAMGIGLVPKPDAAAHTLSALWFPEGVDGSLVGRVAARGVLVAGGLHPAIKARTFRVGHMGSITRQPDALARVVDAVGQALVESGHACSPAAGVAALRAGLVA